MYLEPWIVKNTSDEVLKCNRWTGDFCRLKRQDQLQDPRMKVMDTKNRNSPISVWGFKTIWTMVYFQTGNGKPNTVTSSMVSKSSKRPTKSVRVTLFLVYSTEYEMFGS